MSKEFKLNRHHYTGSTTLFVDVMQSDVVRIGLEKMGRKAATEIEGDARSVGMKDMQAKVTNGTRPGGRSFARVSVPKDGDGGIRNRLDVLGRAVGRHNAPK